MMAPKLPVRVVTSGPSSPAVIVTHGPAIPCIVVAEGDGPSYPIRIDGGLTVGQTYRLKFGKFGQSGSTPPPPVNPPVANFTADVVSGFAPLTVNFTDLSTNTPTSWLWTFGDAGTSMLQNPSHVYAMPGTYTVTLTATNADGSGFVSKVNYITALWTPAFATTGGGVNAHTGVVPGLAGIYQDSVETTPITADGDPVGAANNVGMGVGTNAYSIIQATSGAKPTYRTGVNGLDSQPVFQFDGGDGLQGTFAGGGISQPYTAVLVAQHTTAAGTITDGINSSHRIVFDKNSGNWRLIAGAQLQTPGGANTNWNIIQLKVNGASSAIIENGVSLVTGNAGTQTLTGLTVGANFGLTANLTGKVAYVLIYSSLLSNADLNQIGAYLKLRFPSLTYTPIP